MCRRTVQEEEREEEGSKGLVVLLHFTLLTSRGQRYVDASLLSKCSPTEAV